MNIDIQKLLDEFEKKEKQALAFYNKKRHLTEDFIKGLWLQTILKKHPDLFVYQDARVRYWERMDKGKINPDQYVDLIITNKKDLEYKTEFKKIWDEWTDGLDEMVVCEIKLSSTTVPSRIEHDEIRIGKWHHLYAKQNLNFYFLLVDLGEEKVKKYPGEKLYCKHEKTILKELKEGKV